MTADKLLPKVKANLILEHDVDDELLSGFIRSAISYAEGYQNRRYCRGNSKMSAATEQAVIMLSSHFYESRDGSTAGFFGDNVQAGAAVWQAVNRLLALGKVWQI